MTSLWDMETFWEHVDNSWSPSIDSQVNMKNFEDFEKELETCNGLQSKEMNVDYGNQVVHDYLKEYSINDQRDLLNEAVLQSALDVGNSRNYNVKASSLAASCSQLKLEPPSSTKQSQTYEDISNDVDPTTESEFSSTIGYAEKESDVKATTKCLRKRKRKENDDDVKRKAKRKDLVNDATATSVIEQSAHLQSLNKTVNNFGLTTTEPVAVEQALNKNEKTIEIPKRKRGRKQQASTSGDNGSITSESSSKRKPTNVVKLENALKENEVLRKIIATLMLTSCEAFVAYTSEEIQQIITGLMKT